MATCSPAADHISLSVSPTLHPQVWVRDPAAWRWTPKCPEDRSAGAVAAEGVRSLIAFVIEMDYPLLVRKNPSHLPVARLLRQQLYAVLASAAGDN